MFSPKSGVPTSAVVVIGLGRFGRSVAKTLLDNGHEVFAIDNDAHTVQQLSDIFPHMVQADCTDLDTVKELALHDFPHAVVSIGGDLEASVLTILNLNQVGVKDIWAKANSSQHGRIAQRIGAHHVVYPEADMGQRVAHLVTGKMLDFIEFDDGYAIAKTRAPRHMHDKTLEQSHVRQKHQVTIVGIKRKHENFIYAKPESEVRPGDLLIVSGETHAVERFAALQ